MLVSTNALTADWQRGRTAACTSAPAGWTIGAMAVLLASHLFGALAELRYQPSLKRVRARLDGATVVDTTRSILVWEPMRVVPSYAVPEADVSAALDPAAQEQPAESQGVAFGDGPPVLDPSVPFSTHTAAGEPLTVSVKGTRRVGAAFRLADPDLAGFVVLDFDAFTWWEDEEILGHPSDPFHRIDVRRSSRHVRLEHQGHVLAESDRPLVLFEGTFPLVRYYLPREDVVADLRPGTRQTTCAYKGHATHHSASVGGIDLPDIAWSYEDPLADALPIRSMISFYQERLDLFVDSAPVDRVRTPWS